MADLFLNWGALGPYGTFLNDGSTSTVDTGGVAVDVTFTAQDPYANAFTFNADGYVEPEDDLNKNSFLKLYDNFNQDGAPPTSTATLEFSATDTQLYTDQVQNVAFRINDIDTAWLNGDLDRPSPDGTGFEDIVTVTAYDIDGNEVPVTLTPEPGGPSVSGQTATGTDETDFTDASGSIKVDIAQPVHRIEINYANGDVAQQAVTISDVNFSTVDTNGGDLPPVAVDDMATTPEDTAVIVDVLANDSDPEGQPLTVTGATVDTGTVSVNADNTLTYTPAADYNGPATITYTIEDPAGNSATGEVAVTVEPVNDDPVANDDTPSTPVGTPVTFDPRDNDTDPDGDTLTVTGIGTPTGGTATLNLDGTVTYTPNGGFTGTDTFTYTIDDGNGGTDTADITVTVRDGSGEGRIDTDVFPVPPGLQDIDPLDGLDEDPDPSDDLDNYVGDGSDELISTGDDADTIIAGGGNDTVLPGIDDDTVELGTGDDSLFDVQGADTIFGRQGDDTIVAGTDTFSDYPDFPNDPILSPLGFDRDPNTEDGRDYVEGNRGADLISTGDDADTIDGGGENDTIDGGIDDDSIMGGQGDDSLIGGHGSDSIDGGQGNDYIDGSNIASLAIPDATDPVPENDRDLLQGFLGDDTLIGGDDDDTLEGGSGNDLLDGGIDEDVLRGGNDDDTLLGGDGDDSLYGDSGNDSIDGGADRDVIYVESTADGMNDTVDGGAGGFDADPALNTDHDVLNLSGVGQKDIDWRLVNDTPDSNGNGIDGTIEFLNNGTVTGSMNFFEIEEIVPCFTPGTRIATPQGERPVEDLRVGDRIITRDNGIQAIRWVGRKNLTGAELARMPHMNPILIRRGALGNTMPERDMLVSPNHRILFVNDKTALYFEEREVLVAAKHLTGLDGVDAVESDGISYIHIMFDQHEVVLSNGAWTESFQPGDYTLRGIGDDQRQEIFELFPELERAEGLQAYGAARRSLKRHEAQLLTA